MTFENKNPMKPLGYLENCSKASLLILFMTGVLVCTTAHAKAQLIQQPKSKLKVEVISLDPEKDIELDKPEPLVVVDEVEDEVSSSVINAKLKKDNTKPSIVRWQSPLVFSVTPESIPGLSLHKQPPAPSEADPDTPSIYLSAEHVEGYVDSTVNAQGRAQMIRDFTVVQGEELIYDRKTEVLTAVDNVRINHEGNLFKGDYAVIHTPTYKGYFDKGSYQINETGAHGVSERIDFLTKNDFTFNRATYTLCLPNEKGRYDWILSAKTIDLDFEADKGVAHNAVMRFKNVPILATPWMSFPLSDKRRSGLLVPYFDISDDSGFTYSQPYYLNIAPNYDATLTPFYMSKRGEGLEGEFRYLHPTFGGKVNGLYLPNDRLRKNNVEEIYSTNEEGELVKEEITSSIDKRWSYKLEHDQILAHNLDLLGEAKLSLDLNRASDHFYWQDFSKSSGASMSRLLDSQGYITTSTPGFSTMFRVQRWQTLQDPGAYIIPPYDRTQFRFNKAESYSGFRFDLMGDVTKFESDDETNLKSNSTRGVLQLATSYPIRDAGYFIVPKVTLTSRYYDFDDGIIRPDWKKEDDEVDRRMMHFTSTLPTLSLDTGLIFERETNLFNKEYTQTLEPRVMYTYTPYRKQSFIPLYDTNEYDYNLATVYLDNPYVGHDRIADVNMMTVGVGTRWIDPQSGKQALSFNVAQRLRFANQRVTLDNEPITSRYSDILFNVSTELVRDWRFDALTQYDIDEKRSQRSLLMAGWRPGQYRVMNFGYRLQRRSSEQLDFSWQWPLGSPWISQRLPDLNKNGGRWYSVGRLNYSLKDSKMVDSVFGFEYQSCCWISRVVLERLSTGRTKTNQRIMFQLEFSGLSRVGMNPLQRLHDNINNYQTIQNKRVVRPNDFYLYD